MLQNSSEGQGFARISPVAFTISQQFVKQIFLNADKI